jgi:hypothetical protein
MFPVHVFTGAGDDAGGIDSARGFPDAFPHERTQAVPPGARQAL